MNDAGANKSYFYYFTGRNGFRLIQQNIYQFRNFYLSKFRLLLIGQQYKQALKTRETNIGPLIYCKFVSLGSVLLGNDSVLQMLSKASN